MAIDGNIAFIIIWFEDGKDYDTILFISDQLRSSSALEECFAVIKR